MPKAAPTLDLRDYAPVADRITLFYERFPDGRINTELVSSSGGEVVFKALVFRSRTDDRPAATGWASKRVGDGEVNAVACLENTETSAIGRALANLGFTASGRRPSREEMVKADRVRRRLTIARREGLTGSELQARANAARDLLGLVRLAESRGLSQSRAAVLRARVGTAPGLPLARVRRVELRLRAWLRRGAV